MLQGQHEWNDNEQWDGGHKHGTGICIGARVCECEDLLYTQKKINMFKKTLLELKVTDKASIKNVQWLWVSNKLRWIIPQKLVQ
jgi:hypothetical protein